MNGNELNQSASVGNMAALESVREREREREGRMSGKEQQRKRVCTFFECAPVCISNICVCGCVYVCVSDYKCASTGVFSLCVSRSASGVQLEFSVCCCV